MQTVVAFLLLLLLLCVASQPPFNTIPDKGKGKGPKKWNAEYTKQDFLENKFPFDTFQEWRKAFGKEYKKPDGHVDFDEEDKRYHIWLDNLKVISGSNSKDLPYKLRMNQFGDLTNDEFSEYVKGGFIPQNTQHSDNSGDPGNSNMRRLLASDSIDWTSKGVVTPVKNQGQCGSCWAFSAVGAIECNWAILNSLSKPVALSEQQLVDCAGSTYECAGCNGGQMTGAMQYTADNKGLCTESEYKYTARNGKCKASTCNTKYSANKGGYTEITKYSSSALEAAVAQGCVSVGIEADQTAFQHYSSGVLTGTCGTRIDHGVLVVGYGTSGSQQYWKVKNSWGASWGMKGYIDICRNCNKNGKDGECGILMEPIVPNFKDSSPGIRDFYKMDEKKVVNNSIYSYTYNKNIVLTLIVTVFIVFIVIVVLYKITKKLRKKTYANISGIESEYEDSVEKVDEN